MVFPRWYCKFPVTPNSGRHIAVVNTNSTRLIFFSTAAIALIATGIAAFAVVTDDSYHDRCYNFPIAPYCKINLDRDRK